MGEGAWLLYRTERARIPLSDEPRSVAERMNRKSGNPHPNPPFGAREFACATQARGSNHAALKTSAIPDGRTGRDFLAPLLIVMRRRCSRGNRRGHKHQLGGNRVDLSPVCAPPRTPITRILVNSSTCCSSTLRSFALVPGFGLVPRLSCAFGCWWSAGPRLGRSVGGVRTMVPPNSQMFQAVQSQMAQPCTRSVRYEQARRSTSTRSRPTRMPGTRSRRARLARRSTRRGEAGLSSPGSMSASSASAATSLRYSSMKGDGVRVEQPIQQSNNRAGHPGLQPKPAGLARRAAVQTLPSPLQRP